MTKVVYNNCYGGFSLSAEGIRLGREISGNPMWGGPCFVGEKYYDGSVITEDFGMSDMYGRDIDRTDPVLVEVVETLGDLASGSCALLRIANIPEGTLYRIDEYDGNESVMTQSDYDWRTA